MSPYAQTNIQLYNQFCFAGWGESDLRRVHDAYELATSLFAGQLRPNHKVFLAHLVGTASIIAIHGARPEVATAGLLHSVYSHGEFGDGSRGISEPKRRQVRRAVGETCETLIARYTSPDCDVTKLAARLEKRGTLPAIDQDVAFIKLADLLEDYCDLGMGYAPNKPLPNGARTKFAFRDAVAGLASALGHMPLAAELHSALDPEGEFALPDFLCGSGRKSFVVAPRSHKLKGTVRLGRFYRRWRGKLSRAFGRLPDRRPIGENDGVVLFDAAGGNRRVAVA